MTFDDIASAKRLVLGALLVFLLWLAAGRLYSFAEQVKRQDREQKQTLDMLERSRQRELAIIQQQRESIYGQRAATRLPVDTTRPNSSKTSHPKMPPSAVVNHLRRANAFKLVANPERRLHCMDNQGDWDYICLFHPDPISNANWAQFGVMVDNAHIIEVSETLPYPSSITLPAPLSLTTR